MSLPLQQPFEIKMSHNVEEFVFNKHWDPYRYYHAVFNAQRELVPRIVSSNTSWAMVSDWRQWLAQIPDAERLCVRKLNTLVEQGLTHMVTVSDDHPVARWQAEKVNRECPELEFHIVSTFEEAYQWLSDKGFDVDLKPVEFDSHWLTPDASFETVLCELHVDKQKFAAALCS